MVTCPGTGNWDFEATLQDDHWTGEFCIPFSDLGLEKAPTAGEWRLTLEHCNPSGESSHWNGQVEFVKNKKSIIMDPPAAIDYSR